jgi:hypothetical protein
MLWIVLYSELTHCLLSIAFSCVVTNFMVHLCYSYFSGTLREKDAHFLSLVTVDCNVAIIMCNWINYQRRTFVFLFSIKTGSMWTGFIWLRLVTGWGGGAVVKPVVNLYLYNMKNFWSVAKELVSSREGQCTKEFFLFINSFRSYVEPHPTVWFSSSAPMSEDIQHSFCCICSPAVRACPTLFLMWYEL